MIADATYVFADAKDACAFPFDIAHVYTHDPSIPAHKYTEWSPPERAKDVYAKPAIPRHLHRQAFIPAHVYSPSGLQYLWSDQFNDYLPLPPTQKPEPAFVFKPPMAAFVPRYLRVLPERSFATQSVAWLHFLLLLGRVEELAARDPDESWRRCYYEDNKRVTEDEPDLIAPPSTPRPTVLPIWSTEVAAVWGQTIDDSLPAPPAYNLVLCDSPMPDECLTCDPAVPPINDTNAPVVETPPPAPHWLWRAPTVVDLIRDRRRAPTAPMLKQPSSRVARQSDAVLLHPRPKRWDSIASAPSAASSASGFWSTTGVDRASSASSAPLSRSSWEMSPSPYDVWC